MKWVIMLVLQLGLGMNALAINCEFEENECTLNNKFCNKNRLKATCNYKTVYINNDQKPLIISGSDASGKRFSFPNLSMFTYKDILTISSKFKKYLERQGYDTSGLIFDYFKPEDGTIFYKDIFFNNTVKVEDEAQTDDQEYLSCDWTEGPSRIISSCKAEGLSCDGEVECIENRPRKPGMLYDMRYSKTPVVQTRVRCNVTNCDNATLCYKNRISEYKFKCVRPEIEDGYDFHHHGNGPKTEPRNGSLQNIMDKFNNAKEGSK